MTQRFICWKILLCHGDTINDNTGFAKTARHIIWVMPKYVFEKAILNDILITFKLFTEYHTD